MIHCRFNKNTWLQRQNLSWLLNCRQCRESKKKKACSTALYLSSLGVGDAGVAKVAALPLGVEAVALQLPQLKGGVEGPSLHLDGNGIDPD